MHLVELNDLARALYRGGHELVSIVGGGGKTTTLFALGAQLAGTRVLTTTTKMGRDRTGGRPVLFAPSDDELVDAARTSGAVVAWAADGGHKALGVTPATCDHWFDLVDHVIVEADGSRRRPFKAPMPHEPVVPASPTLLIASIGADALGRVIADQCQRPLRVAAVAGCSPYVRLTPERAARVLLDDRGSRKAQPADARFAVVVARVDDAAVPLVAELTDAVTDLATERGLDVPVLAVTPDLTLQHGDRTPRFTNPT